MKPRVLLALRPDLYSSMFSPRDLDRLRGLADVINPTPPAEVTVDFLRANLATADIAISSWFTPAFDANVLDAAPNLKLVAHAGGSVRPIVSEHSWKRGVRITSSAAAISYGVAEYCLGLILTGSKRAFWLGQATREGHWKDAGTLFGGWHEIYQQKIGVIGAGFVGCQLLRLLQNFTCDLLVYDPYASDERLKQFNAIRCATLEELFERANVVSLNAPLTPETEGMIRGHHFARLRPGSLFINTSRGQLIHEAEMTEQLATGRFVACIDVTTSEPPVLDHPLRRLPNVWLTPHVAGVVAENKLRIGTMVVDEIAQFADGSPYKYEITEEKLKTMA